MAFRKHKRSNGYRRKKIHARSRRSRKNRSYSSRHRKNNRVVSRGPFKKGKRATALHAGHSGIVANKNLRGRNNGKRDRERGRPNDYELRPRKKIYDQQPKDNTDFGYTELDNIFQTSENRFMDNPGLIDQSLNAEAAIYLEDLGGEL